MSRRILYTRTTATGAVELGTIGPFASRVDAELFAAGYLTDDVVRLMAITDLGADMTPVEFAELTGQAVPL